MPKTEQLIPATYSWEQILEYGFLLGVAYLLAMPIAFNRERQAQSAGIRTFPLVALAACAYMLTARSVLDGSDAHARVMYGLITGMGFIGGGAILKNDGRVSGTATAASLWMTGAIGMAVAYRQFPIAVLISLITFFTLWFGANAKKKLGGEGEYEERGGKQEDKREA